MKTLTFTYTKKDNSVSTRTLVAQIMPTDKYAGIDISDLDAIDAAEFAARAVGIHESYVLDMKRLQEEFDLKHNYRQFLAGGMSNITEI